MQSSNYGLHLSTLQSTCTTQIFKAPKKKATGKAMDIWFFFSKGTRKGGSIHTYSKLCNHQRRGDGIYSASTSIGVLCSHLMKAHSGGYLNACQKNGWQPKAIPNQLQGEAALVEWIVGFDESINVMETKLFC
ncbi:hypothetical protein M422DRAFT_239295 [Sphaerobolus stellatus SS14]|nr:hypothetical protein M422DRAFT_239295 [Sphaerobolus stellatus SS14]